MEEAKVTAESSSSFDIVEGHECSDFYVMDGLVQGCANSETHKCNLVTLNLGREAVPKGIELGTLTEVNQVEFSPIPKVLQIHQSEVRLSNIDHLKKIKLDHLPIKYRSDYAKIIMKYATFLLNLILM